MRRSAATLGRVVVAALVAVVALAAWAQDFTVRALVDRPTIRENESFTYTIRAEGSGVRGEPELGPLQQQFDVLQSGSNQQIQIVNGRTSQTTEWQFQLMPKGSGEFSIPAIRVGDKQTNVVALRVLPQLQQSASGAPADIFMELEATPSTVYVQSQVLFTLRLFTGVATGRATLTPPGVTGGEAIVEKLGEDSQYQTQRGGRDFVVHERRYAIFPQQAGALTIGPATFEAMVVPDRGLSRVQRFRSSTLEIDVQPAVAPPASMPTGVWLPAQSVRLTEEWNDDSVDVTVGVPRTRHITVEADGVLETQLPDLQVAQQAGIRQYADQPELDRDVTPQGMRSRRTLNLAVIAQTPGDVTLAPVQLPWWNVTAQRWELAELPARTLHIAPSAESVPPPTPSPVATETAPAPVTAGGERNVWPIVTGALALAWLVTAALWWRSRHARAAAPRATESASPARADKRPAARKQFRELQTACAANDADAARRALLQWAESRFPDAAPRSLGALAAVLPDGVAREVLDLEAHIYGATPGVWDGHALSSALPTLEAAGMADDASNDEPLLPLYR